MFLRTLFVTLFVSSFFASVTEGETVSSSYNSQARCACPECAGDALTGNTGKYRLETVFLHELMHAAGNVAHPQSGVPSVVSKDTTYYTELQPADVGALWSQYGQKPGTDHLDSNSLYRIASGTPWPKDPDGIARVSYALDPELEILSLHYEAAWDHAISAIMAVTNIEFYKRSPFAERLGTDIFVQTIPIDGKDKMLAYAYYPTGDFVKRYTDERYGDIYIDMTDSFYVASVPEPSTLVLGFGCSMFTLVFYYKRRMMR